MIEVITQMLVMVRIAMIGVLVVVMDTAGKFFSKILPKKSIEKQVVLITGSASDLGRSLAVALSGYGARLILVDKNEAGNEETAEMVRGYGGAEVFPYTCDLGDREDVYRTTDAISAQVGDVHMLINCAGMSHVQNFLDTSDETIIKTMDFNFMSHCWMIRSFLPKMIERNQGHIVTVSSAAGMLGCNQMTGFCASKHAAVGFHKALTMELDALGCDNIQTTLVCPSFIKGRIADSVQILNKLNALFPVLDPDNAARMIVYFILRNYTFVGIPFAINILFMIHSLFPFKVTEYIAQSYGVTPSINGLKADVDGFKKH